jgi:hypothetical protein
MHRVLMTQPAQPITHPAHVSLDLCPPVMRGRTTDNAASPSNASLWVKFLTHKPEIRNARRI